MERMLIFRFMRNSPIKKQRSLSRRKKIVFGEERTPLHPPTTHLWDMGDGRIDQDTIKVSGWNVNGIRAIMKKNQLNPFLQATKPDFMCINQTKIDYKAFQKDMPNYSFPQDYHQYWNFSKVSAGYAGVLTLARHKPIRVIEDIPEEPAHSLEGRVITLQYEDFYLVNAYKPNAGHTEESWNYAIEIYDPIFTHYLRKLLETKNVIVFGDMNLAHTELDLANPKGNINKPGFSDQQRGNLTKILDLGFVDSYRVANPDGKQFSYWSQIFRARERNVGWRLDYILVSRGLKVENGEVHDQVTGSDHCPVSALIAIN